MKALIARIVFHRALIPKPLDYHVDPTLIETGEFLVHLGIGFRA